MVFNKKCARKRGVECCGQCCRFVNCRDGTKPAFPYHEGNLRLGLAIICGVVEQYREAYKKGKKNTCKRLAKWFLTEQTAILSAETYDGQAIIDNLIIKCQREYGNINDIWNAKEKNARKKTSALKQTLKETEDIKDKHRIMAKISAIKGELNE